ncbi:hypothetical protein ACGFNU_32965 [Spirillospora sp. NPDC048911]|uniref:hypothetical protein n=1 Tax=Spirillospora sp. NPDC048911 TaxID=3364527 RepID=UPI00371D4FE8
MKRLLSLLTLTAALNGAGLPAAAAASAGPHDKPAPPSAGTHDDHTPPSAGTHDDHTPPLLVGTGDLLGDTDEAFEETVDEFVD